MNKKEKKIYETQNLLGMINFLREFGYTDKEMYEISDLSKEILDELCDRNRFCITDGVSYCFYFLFKGEDRDKIREKLLQDYSKRDVNAIFDFVDNYCFKRLSNKKKIMAGVSIFLYFICNLNKALRSDAV